MLISTFQHLEGFGSKKEAELWEKGILTWNDYHNTLSAQLNLFEDRIEKSIFKSSFEALQNGDADFFAKKLKNNLYYRLVLNFPNETMFLDIETTGLSRYYDNITVIGWSINKEYGFVYSENNKDKLVEAFKRAKCIVTFNGSIFDLPFIRKEFPEIKIPHCHIDLRFMSKRMGYSGGLKSIEKIIGIKRSNETSNLDGEMAPILWHKYREGDKYSLKKLIQYNKEDLDSLKYLLDLYIIHEIQKTPFKGKISPYVFSNDISQISFDSRRNINFIKINKYVGHKGPKVKISQLNNIDKLIVVGIDLTGSEERSSGWCKLKKGKAFTKQIAADEDIISETLKAGASIVSIDSPLSLPFGRKTPFDDDEGRKEFGIMRECERVLKKRGVNVYPSLIPSMQRLTARGIRLANKFREYGIPVIESYPGAAQDILGIPRKGSSLEYLKRGLKQFGIKGKFIHQNVSHDELDAITSAIVGYFFWSGNFEALGNINEDYLIIPSIDQFYIDWLNKDVIAFCGPISSGKTTAGNYLKGNGYTYGRFSMVIEDLVRKAGMEATRLTMQTMGEYVHEQLGQRWLCNQLLTRYLSDSDKIVVDGLRFPEDHAFMKEKFGDHYKLVYLQCRHDIRKNRYMTEHRNDTDFDLAMGHSVESEVERLHKLADYTIVNEEDYLYLYNEINKIINS